MRFARVGPSDAVGHDRHELSDWLSFGRFIVNGSFLMLASGIRLQRMEPLPFPSHL